MIQNIKKIDFSYRSKSMVAQWGDELGSAMMKWVISAWANMELHTSSLLNLWKLVIPSTYLSDFVY